MGPRRFFHSTQRSVGTKSAGKRPFGAACFGHRTAAVGHLIVPDADLARCSCATVSGKNVSVSAPIFTLVSAGESAKFAGSFASSAASFCWVRAGFAPSVESKDTGTFDDAEATDVETDPAPIRGQSVYAARFCVLVS